MINYQRNYFLEALRNDFNLKSIEIDNRAFNVQPVEYEYGFRGKVKTAYPPAVYWEFHDGRSYSFAPTPKFREYESSLAFGIARMEHCDVEYDQEELIRVIELSAEGKTSDEINLILHGRAKPPSSFGYNRRSRYD